MFIYIEMKDSFCNDVFGFKASVLGANTVYELFETQRNEYLEGVVLKKTEEMEMKNPEILIPQYKFYESEDGRGWKILETYCG